MTEPLGPPPDPHRPMEPEPDFARRRFIVALSCGTVAFVGVTAYQALRGSPSVEATSPPPTPAPPTVTPTPVQVPAISGSVATSPVDLGRTYELVLSGGRVIDPETGYDHLSDVGIDGGRVTAIVPLAAGTPRLIGEQTQDVTGHVVAPGFIDLLSYEPNPLGVWFKVADGVTSNLAMHGLANFADPFFNQFEGQVPIHFGGAFSQHITRGRVGLSAYDTANEDQLLDLEQRARNEIANGMTGFSFSPEYSPGTSVDEIMRLAEVAVEENQVLFFHLRFSDPDPPGTNAEAIAEVLDIARQTGVSVHIQHLTSTGGTYTMAESLATLNAARAEGIDVTACVYPYDFWATTLASARFSDGWQDRFRIGYEDLQIAGTDERLTAQTFPAAKGANRLVAALGTIPEDELRMALREPWVMLGSDSILEESRNNHPRCSGTFARTLGHYSRDVGLLTLPDALAKMTILPAKRVEGMIPSMKRKGRIQVGADADITVFNPDTIIDAATVARPDLPSVGVNHVLVNGTFVMRDAVLQRDQFPGVALKAGT